MANDIDCIMSLSQRYGSVSLSIKNLEAVCLLVYKRCLTMSLKDIAGNVALSVYKRLLQNIVSFIGLFFKRDL